MTYDELDKDFAQQLTKEDELGVVIRAHLHTERFVNDLLSIYFPKPELLSKIRLSYSDKVNLLGAANQLEQLRKPLLFLGTIRNKFAHNLGYVLEKGIVSDYYKSFDEQYKQDLHAIFKIAEWEDEKKDLDNFQQMNPKDQFIFISLCMRTVMKGMTLGAAKAKLGQTHIDEEK